MIGDRRAGVGRAQIVGRADRDDPPAVDRHRAAGLVAEAGLDGRVERIVGEGQRLTEEEVHGDGPVVMRGCPAGLRRSMHLGPGEVEGRLA